MAITYKQKCSRCNKNYVTATWKTRYVLCLDCQKREMVGEITDPKMKKFFDIPEEFYLENSFLRSIKINYLRYQDLSGDQIAGFKRVVEEMKIAKGMMKKPAEKPAKPVAPAPASAAKKAKPAAAAKKAKPVKK
jgi:hypothetical protein